MRQLALNLAERSYSIYIEADLLAQADLLSGYCRGENVLILSNETIAPLYLNRIKQKLAGINVHHFLLADGESHKNLSNFSAVIDYLIQHEFRRNDTLIALGGGVVGDLGGFVAASYQRGMDLIQVPTSLLAQVDSSVGGKTAVNHPLGKNMIGAFFQPKAVLIDINTLDTLPEREFISGMAEIVKYAMLGESRIKQLFMEHSTEILSRRKDLLSELIYLSCAKKAEVVAADEEEKGVRALLNLGHTFGHAIERITQYKRYLHGEAVAIGIHMAINLSCSKKLLSDKVALQYKDLMNRLGLPESAESIELPEMLEAMRLDKKNMNSQYRLVLPEDTHCVIIEEDDLALLSEAITLQLK